MFPRHDGKSPRMKPPDEPTSQAKTHARRVARALARAYPEVHCALVHKNPYELLVATILSAQCTDARVNLTTPELFRRYPDAASLAAAPPAELERIIRSTGFFRAKARNLLAMAARIVERHQGEIPRALDDLVALGGVGRKTANVVLGTAYGIPSGVVVDTHVKRLSRRIGLTTSTTPERIEADLQALLPKSQWIDLSHRLIQHGRLVCLARRPRCESCSLEPICPQVGVAAAKPSTPIRSQAPRERPARTRSRTPLDA